jgi:hypothetical protein
LKDENGAAAIGNLEHFLNLRDSAANRSDRMSALAKAAVDIMRGHRAPTKSGTAIQIADLMD